MESMFRGKGENVNQCPVSHSKGTKTFNLDLFRLVEREGREWKIQDVKELIAAFKAASNKEELDKLIEANSPKLVLNAFRAIFIPPIWNVMEQLLELDDEGTGLIPEFSADMFEFEAASPDNQNTEDDVGIVANNLFVTKDELQTVYKQMHEDSHRGLSTLAAWCKNTVKSSLVIWCVLTDSESNILYSKYKEFVGDKMASIGYEGEWHIFEDLMRGFNTEIEHALGLMQLVPQFTKEHISNPTFDDYMNTAYGTFPVLSQLMQTDAIVFSKMNKILSEIVSDGESSLRVYKDSSMFETLFRKGSVYVKLSSLSVLDKTGVSGSGLLVPKKDSIDRTEVVQETAEAKEDSNTSIFNDLASHLSREDNSTTGCPARYDKVAKKLHNWIVQKAGSIYLSTI